MGFQPATVEADALKALKLGYLRQLSLSEHTPRFFADYRPPAQEKQAEDG